MANNLFNDILHIDPVYKNLKTENQLCAEYENIKKEYHTTTPLFEIEFNKPLTSIRKLYWQLITNETTVLFNILINDFERTSVPEETHFLYQKHLKNFSYSIKNIANYISERELSSNIFIKPSKDKKADEAYIIYFLKANSIMLFMELQERFNNATETYTQEEIHEIYFNEEAPENLLVINYNGQQIQTKKKPEKETKIFRAIKGDLETRVDNLKIIEYHKIIAKPDNFARSEEILNEVNIIDNNYNFIATKGNKQLLAAFILKLISIGYFNERIFPRAKKINDKDITNFFAHRYGSGSDTDREFRNFKGAKQHQLKSIIDLNYWIDNIK